MKRLLCALAAACTIACGESDVPRYSGSAMNDAVPDSAGSLTLTFYSRTDTSFGGVLQLGPPLSGGGRAYAWHAGGELKIVTVGHADGDTIVWRSRSTDADVGGRFEVTGGPHAGQGGTWRARLVSGPAATSATLRRPPSLPIPPWSALWPLVVLTLAVVAAARWIRVAPAATPDGTDVVEPLAPGRSLSGISGWLFFFAFAQCVSVIVALFGLGHAPATLRSGLRVGSVIVAMRPLIVLEFGVSLVVPALIAIGVLLTVRRDRRAPRFWFAYLIVSAAYLLIDLAVGQYLQWQLTRLVGSRYDDAGHVGGASTLSVMRQIVVTLLWAMYWTRSERVRATFGAAALDSTARPIRRPVHATTTVVPAPRRRGLVLRIAAAVVGALVLLAGMGLWASRVRPYFVPAGVDIRTKVAGRWDWTNRASPCGDSAHVIAFTGDGKQMTITQQNRWVDSLGRDRTTSTYDIQSVTGSTIRGAIRGEERRAPDGVPVVWDLVLVSPDEYRWHRTDWSTSWSYTAPVVRCDPRAPRRAGGG